MQILNVNGASSSIVKQVQRGTIYFYLNEESLTVNINKTDFNKAIILLNCYGYAITGVNVKERIAETCYIYSVNEDSFIVKRYGIEMNSYVSWQVIEFN